MKYKGKGGSRTFYIWYEPRTRTLALTLFNHCFFVFGDGLLKEVEDE